MNDQPIGGHNTRRRPAHGVLVSPDGPTIVFLTVCTRHRTPRPADPSIRDLLRKLWQGASGWLVGRYVFMPDHIHMFAGWNGGKWSLETWVQFWKARFSVVHKTPAHRWQTGHWDTRMRSREDCEARWSYVIENPVRHGLMESPDQWPYAGTIHDLEWARQEQARQQPRPLENDMSKLTARMVYALLAVSLFGCPGESRCVRFWAPFR